MHTYNAPTHQMCQLCLVEIVLPADNLQQSEEASHIGPKGSCACHKCKVGGPTVVKEMDDGFHALHEVSELTFAEFVNFI
jgi:hypothetical protein